MKTAAHIFCSRRKVSLSLLFTILFLLYCGCSGREESTSPQSADTLIKGLVPQSQGNYFYSNGKRISFTRVENRMPVRVRSSAAYEMLLNTTRSDLKVDTMYKFRGNIAVLYNGQNFLNSIDSIRIPNLVQPSNDLVALIKVDETNAHFIVTNRVTAKFRPSVTDKKIDSIAQAMGCKILEKSTVRHGRVIFECDTEKIIQLANSLFESDLVEFSHPDFIAELEVRSGYIPNDPLFKKQWHLNNTGQFGGMHNADINAPEAWEISKGSSDVIIAFIDDAFDVKHEDLASNFYMQKDFSADPPDDDVYNPDETHGTNVLGVAVAKADNKLGVSGSCPECKFMAVRALDGSSSKQAAAFDFVVSSGAWIISNSWGYTLESLVTDDVVDAINNAAIHGRGGLGCIIFFAMTNQRVDNCGLHPDISSLKNVIAISRSTNLDKLGNGGFGDCMELIAPTKGGTLGITTTDITGKRGESRTNYFDDFSGTSSATPLVAGVAGLILSVNPKLSREEVTGILIRTADKIDAPNARYDRNGFSSTHGYGRVNALKALKASIHP